MTVTDDALAALFEADDPHAVADVNWQALGYDREPQLDEETREAIALLEPAAPRAWRSKGRVMQPRDNQRPPPGDWSVWLAMCGRGWGKTFAGANTLADWAVREKGDYAVVAPTFGDARKICVEGPSGIKQALGDDLVDYNKAEFILYLRNGSRIVLASADAPDRIRGLNLAGAWTDEVGSYRNTEVWYDALDFALREGDPRVVATTTPRRGNRILKDLLDQVSRDTGDVVLTRGHTMENADNLSAKALRRLQTKYEGTRLGLQEMQGEMLSEVDGALVTGALIEATRVRVDEVPDLHRIAIGVDPATTNNDGSDHTGIVVVGIGSAPAGWQPPAGRVVLAGTPHLYVLQDASIKASPETWARRVLEMADEWQADVIAAETNQGGDLTETTTRLVAGAEDRYMPRYHGVSASKGKKARAEPVGGLWEQHRVHLIDPMPHLEDQWAGWVPAESNESPDRIDAMCWAAVELMPELSAKSGTQVRMLAG